MGKGENVFLGAGPGGVEGMGSAALRGKGQAVVSDVDGDQQSTTGLAEGLNEGQADHPGSDDHYSVIEFGRGTTNGMESNGKRFDQSRVLERQRIGRAIQNSLGNGHILGEGAMLPVIFAGDTQDAAFIAKVDFAALAEITLTAVDGRVEGNPIAKGPLIYTLAQSGDNTGRLVAHDNGRAAPPGAAVHSMHVAATNAAGFHSNEDLIRGRSGSRHLFIGKALIIFEHESFHRQNSGDSNSRRTVLKAFSLLRRGRFNPETALQSNILSRSSNQDAKFSPFDDPMQVLVVEGQVVGI